MHKKYLIAGFLVSLFFASFSAVFAQNFNDDYDSVYEKQAQKYRHYYQNPPSQNFGAYGRYVYLSNRTRYTHSRSPLKNKYHAARIDAYNWHSGNIY